MLFRFAGAQTPRSTLGFDTDATVPASYAQGRLTSAWSDSGYTWHYSYDLAGHVSIQTLQTPFVLDDDLGNPYQQYIRAQYGYDGEGRLTDLYYPGAMSKLSQLQPGDHYQYTFDLLGRQQKLTGWDPTYGITTTRAQNAQYNAASQITSWQESANWAGSSWNTLTRSYDDQRGWLKTIKAVIPTSPNDPVLDFT